MNIMGEWNEGNVDYTSNYSPAAYNAGVFWNNSVCLCLLDFRASSNASAWSIVGYLPCSIRYGGMYTGIVDVNSSGRPVVLYIGANGTIYFWEPTVSASHEYIGTLLLPR